MPVADIAYLPQGADIDRSFPASVSELVGLGLWKRSGPFGSIGRADRACHRRGAARRSGSTASCGAASTRSRVGSCSARLFARVLLQDAQVILLDEPFTAIDAQTVTDLMKLIHRWNVEGRTVVAVLHDPALVRAHFPQTLLMAREPIGWGQTSEVYTPRQYRSARRRCLRRGTNMRRGMHMGWARMHTAGPYHDAVRSAARPVR